MTQMSVSQRFQLAQKLLSLKQKVALAITDELFLHHPDWAVSYGESGHEASMADACFHMEFLAGAVEADSPEAFADYARWRVRMLGARGIGKHTLEEDFAQFDKHLSAALEPAERNAVSAYLVRGQQACTEPASALDAEPDDDPLHLTRKVFLSAILSGKRLAALGTVEEALRSNHHHVDLYVDVISKSLYQVGELWESNQISVAQEHMATAIAQYVIAAIYPQLATSADHLGKMVVTGVSGEQHQIGANLLADTMEAKGWTVRFLGTNLPHSSVLATVEEASTDVLCISTTILCNLPSVAELIRLVRKKMGEQTPRIVLGGAAYRIAPQFAREVGVEEPLTDLRQALAVLCA